MGEGGKNDGGGSRSPERLDPRALPARLEQFLLWSLASGYSPRTVQTRRWAIESFLSWCQMRELHYPAQLTRPLLERYQRHLYYYRQRDGRPLKLNTQLGRLHQVRAFFKWLLYQGHILHNPASELRLPALPRRLPKEVLSVEEVEQVLRQPSLSTAVGLRDRAALETLYSTGLRRRELCCLQLHDLELEQELLWVREGKGGQQRLVPLGSRASGWLRRYLLQSRPRLLGSAAEPEELFVTSKARPLRPSHLTHLVAAYVDAAGLDKRGSCHLLRHSMATAMLEAGADLRSLQKLLGHRSLASTQLYTHLSVQHLKKVHRRTHPAERSSHKGGSDDESEPEEESSQGRGHHGSE